MSRSVAKPRLTKVERLTYTIICNLFDARGLFNLTNEEFTVSEKNKDRALKSPEAIYHELRKNKSDIVVTATDAQQIWKFFRKQEFRVTHFSQEDYRAFLQAAMMAAIEASAAMSWIETLFRSAYKPNASLKGILRALVKTALKKYYNRVIGNDPEIYLSVRNTILYSHRPYFDSISNGLDL